MNLRKVGVVGCGFVGSATAFALMQSRLYSEMVLVDVNNSKAEGEAIDISDGLPYSAPMSIYAGDYKDLEDASLIIITAGANQKPGETRLDLIEKNKKIMDSVVTEIKKTAFEGILLIVSNPVDILTYEALKVSGYPENRVIGSGTVLDTARLKDEISQHVIVDSQNVHTMIIGEHGDSEVPVWSITNISGVPINEFCELRGHYNHDEGMKKLYENVRDCAYKIIEKKGATYYGIAMAVTRIARCIVRDEHAVLPVSTILHGEYGINDVCLSIPSILGRNGVEKVLEIKLNDAEEAMLNKSATELKNYIK